MMKAYSGFKAEQATAREQLPIGGYVAKIMNTEVKDYSWGSVLVISFDIAEGEHKDFFADDYRGQQGEDKKWRGTYRLTIPKDDGSEKDGWSKRTFNNFIYCIEDSNPGYRWDWNEAGLKGKTIGLLFRNEEWEWQDKSGWTTRAFAVLTVGDVHDGHYKMPKDKPLKNKQNNAQPSAAIPASNPWDEASSDADLPF